MDLIHLPTVYLFLSFIYLLMPVAIWIALNKQKSRALIWWCVGGEIFAIGLVLVGLRPILPSWVSYSLANLLSWIAVYIQAMSLLLVLKRQLPIVLVTAMTLLWLVLFEYFRLGLQNQHLRFGWALSFVAIAFAYIAHLSFKISQIHQLRNARILAVIYVVGALVLCIRIVRIAFGYTHPDILAQGVDSYLVVFSGVIVSVLGSFAFVGLFIERAAKREIAATEERARQEESLRLGEQIAQLERQRTLGVMSYSFAHEFSQPLTAILMDAHSAKDSLTAEQVNVGALREAIDGIEGNAIRTRELIDRIRSFIRPSQHAFERVDMRILLEDVMQLLTHDIRQQQIKFELDFEDEDCSVIGDKVQLSQIVLNVYRNAIQAMDQSPLRKIFVTVGKQDDRIVVRVRDTGPGLDGSLRSTIGMPFVTTKNDGLGVGLSISQSIAEKHSGSLTITNAMDGGALVELNLPAASN